MTQTHNEVLTPQERFNQTYITATEICARLKIARTQLMFAHQRGSVPEPITMQTKTMFIWERAIVEPYLVKWEASLAVFRDRKALREHIIANTLQVTN